LPDENSLSTGPGKMDIRGLAVAFGQTNVLRNLDLALPSGEARVILGPNGAGKSTLFNALSGLVKPRSGSIHIGGQSVIGKDPHLLARHFITRSFQVPQLSPDLSGAEHIRLALASPSAVREKESWTSEHSRASAAGILNSFHLDHLAGVFPSAMTHAERKMLDVAIAMSRTMPVLLLDEAVAGLGPAEKDFMRTLVLRHIGKSTIILIEHDTDFIAGLGLPILFMDQGRFLFEGSFSEVERMAKEAGVYF
jgi:ABC-type branched-subunit amino acid transport system ATPase component